MAKSDDTKLRLLAVYNMIQRGGGGSLPAKFKESWI